MHLPLAAAPGHPPGLLDWGIVLLFLAGITAFGLWVSRRGGSSGREFFLGGRSIPGWAAAISFVATSLSAATFIGGPGESYAGNLGYLLLPFAGILGGVLAAFWIIPAAWRCGGETPYALLEARMGPDARAAAATAFLAGRLLASGARHMITGTAFCYLAFGELKAGPACAAIVLCGVLGTLYAAKGGIKTVIWTDIALFAVLMLSVVACFVLLATRMPATPAEVLDACRAEHKLRLLDFSANPASATTVWAGLAATLFYAAAYGTDQDMAQRMLTTRSAGSATRSLIGGVATAVPLTLVFLLLGIGLWVFYRRPELSGHAGPAPEAGQVFAQFIRDELPVGLKGLLMAGLAATSLGALASAIAAMAASACTDFAHLPGGRHVARHPRWASLGMGALLTGVALGCFALYDPKADSLLQFALKVMTLAYTGLLGVFACVLLTRRGSGRSAGAAIVAGALVAAVLWFAPVVPFVHEAGTDAKTAQWAPNLLGEPGTLVAWKKLAFPWVMLLGSGLSFTLCCLGKPAPAAPKEEADRAPAREPELAEAER